MYRTPTATRAQWEAVQVTEEETLEIRMRYGTDEEANKAVQDLENERKKRIGWKTPPTPPSAYKEAPGPWTNTISRRVRVEERTPPLPDSPLCTRQYQNKKRTVALRFSPPCPTTLKKPPADSRVCNKTKRTPPEVTKEAARQTNWMKEGKTAYDKANEHLSNSRNLKTEIKQGVQGAIDRLYALIKEMDRALKEPQTAKAGNEPGTSKKTCKDAQTQVQIQEQAQERNEGQKGKGRPEEDRDAFARQMQEQAELIQKSLARMNNLEQVILKYSATMSEANIPRVSYASVAAKKPGDNPQTYRTLHSVAITSEKGHRSADDTLKEVREALNAKEGGVEVERVRKARDGKVIISCRTEDEREKLKHKLRTERTGLLAEDIINKQPMIMITGVLRTHGDGDLFRALRNQNSLVFEGLGEGDDTMEVAYKIRGRNPNTHRVVLKVAPPLWRRLTDTGTVRVDLQTLQVTDRSPLTQCTICLGFGHGKKLCAESQVMCSHCGGPHTRSECADYAVGAPPKCKNCVRERKADVEHNAFNETCPVRIRWDAVVRATVAYG